MRSFLTNIVTQLLKGKLREKLIIKTPKTAKQITLLKQSNWKITEM